MLANERFIVKMTLEQKVNLVTSINPYESSSVGGHEFPVFKLQGQPYDECPDVLATCFPSDKALASSWNPRLIASVYAAIGEETRRVNSFGYFNSTDDYTLEGLSSDNFVTAKFILARTLGLSKSGQAVNFEKTQVGKGERTHNKRFVLDTVLSGAEPTSVLVRNVADMEDISQRYKYSNMFFATASSVEEAARLLLNGCTLVFLSEDFTAALSNFLLERTVRYTEAYKSFRDGDISLNTFDRRVRSLEIFDEKILDAACDRLISLLVRMKDGREKAPVMKGLDGQCHAKFDEISHDALALKAARETVVLLKNEGVLPLARRTRIAVAGEYANDFSYQRDLFGYNPTALMLPFEVINEYEDITTTGYVAGYAKDEPGRVDLTSSAVELCTKSDCTLLYLCAERGEKSLPPEQLELIDALYEKGVSIIAVVACDGNIDLSFEAKCKALLLTYSGGQQGTSAVLDILSGIVSPSGKLVEEVRSPSGEVVHPLGYGLSYTAFEYRKLKVNENGVTFTIANVGNYDGMASVQLYVKKDDAKNFFSSKTMRGYTKVFVAKGDAINVVIPFDENTFKAYNDAKRCYVIEGGVYEICISENFDSDKVKGTIKLAPHVFKDTFENEVVESSDGAKNIQFTTDKEKNAQLKARRRLSFSVKLFVALMLGLYYNGLVAVFAFTPLIPNKGILLYSILGAVAGVFDILLLIYIIVIALQRKKQRALLVTEVLTDMMGKIGEFKEVAKVTYAEPVKEEEEEEEAAEEEKEAGEGDEEKPAEGEEKKEGEEEEGDGLDDLSEIGGPSGRRKKPVAPAERKYDVGLDDTEMEVTFTEQVSLSKLCVNFREFALSYGVNIEMTSVRAIISAMASSKIVILNSVNTELLPDLLDAISAYFGSTPVTEAWPDWESADDLIWMVDGDKYVVSDFTNAVHGAGKTPTKLCVAILSHVESTNILDYFGDFIDYAIHPTEVRHLELREGLNLKLPDNITYFIVPEEGEQMNFTKEVINAATTIDVAISKAPKGEKVEAKHVAVADFNDLVRTARDEAYLSERMWKKVDELFDALNAHEKFYIGNKNIIQMERFTSVLLECGGDESEAFTLMLICKLVPLLKTTRTYKQEGGDVLFSGIIEKMFPDEDLSKVKKALSKIG